MEHILSILLMSIISAFVGFGFARMQDPDMIFHWYKNMLNYLAKNEFKTLCYRKIMFKIRWNKNVPGFMRFDLNRDKYVNDSTLTMYKRSKFLYYITEPLGRCLVCNTTWIGMILTYIFFPSGSLIVFEILTVGVVSAGVVVMLANKYELMQNAL